MTFKYDKAALRKYLAMRKEDGKIDKRDIYEVFRVICWELILDEKFTEKWSPKDVVEFVAQELAAEGWNIDPIVAVEISEKEEIPDEIRHRFWAIRHDDGQFVHLENASGQKALALFETREAAEDFIKRTGLKNAEPHHMSENTGRH